MDENDAILGPATATHSTIQNRRWQPLARVLQPSRSAIWLVLFLLLLVNLTNGISNLPLSRMLERRLCRIYYDTDHDVDEALCKKDGIQQDLAWIMGAFETLWIVGGKRDTDATVT